MEKHKKKQQYEKVEIYEEVKTIIQRLAFDNDITIKELTSEILRKALVNKEDMKQTIKEIRTRKGLD